MSSTWRPTMAYFRAAFVGTSFAVAALFFRRPDLLVLALPLLITAAWSAYTKPTRDPQLNEVLAHSTLREGEATRWRAELSAVPGLEESVAVVTPGRWTMLRPPSGVVTGVTEGDQYVASVVVRSIKWGKQAVGPAIISASSSWGSFRWTQWTKETKSLTTLPIPAVFDSGAPTPHPNGLVGLSRSSRLGDGSEFASIRQFYVGDRLRRIHWPTSLRSGTLHVSSTYADQDSEVQLLLDAFNDVGDSGGIDGAASSFDTTVRAAGAIAEHYLRRGDRVGMRVLGASNLARVPAAAGTSHLRRVLDTLATIEPASERHADRRRATARLPSGVLVIMLTPLISQVPLERAITLTRHGLTVVVIDTLPRGLVESSSDKLAQLAWRIRLLERDREIREVQLAGVPVVRWQGAGSLDRVLRDVSRRSAAPRMGRR